MSRTTMEENVLIEQVAKLEALQELLEDDTGQESPTIVEVNNVASNHPAFKEVYLNLRVAYKKFKMKFVPSSVSEEQFNSSDSPYKYNDVWISKLKKDFQKVNGDVVAFLAKTSSASSARQDEDTKENSANKEEIKEIILRFKSGSSHLTQAIDEIFKKLQSLTEINPNQAQIYSAHQRELMMVLDEKIPSLVTSFSRVAKPGDVEVEKVKKDYAALENTEKTRLYPLVQLIAEKTQFVLPSSSSSSFQAKSGDEKAQTIHLKKVEPPKFSGDEVDYPEFHRKWLAVVGPANLPEEAEVDRLRDAMPRQAKEMLVGIHRKAKAWEILNKRYGDKDLIATKLKNELKNLNFKEKTDHEKVIAITIKVRSLITRLESLGASEALKYDGEFLSAIYFQLPDRQKANWLEFNKNSFSNKWSALLSFLDIVYDKVVQEKLLLASYASPSKDPSKKPPENPKKSFGSAGVLAAKVDDEDKKKDEEQKRIEEVRRRIGKCPLCNQEHTFKSKWSSTPWPSDRLLTCKKFNDMTLKQRGENLERVKGCIRCTSWKHGKDTCRMSLVDCKEMINGSPCHKDHS